MYRAKFLALILATNASCGSVYAQETFPVDAAARDRASSDYYFFPYRDCVIFTIGKVSKGERDHIVLSGEIQRVLKGELKARRHECFRFKEKDSDLSYVDLKRAKNKTCVLAMNDGLWRDSEKEPLDIMCASFKNVGENLTPAQISKWEQNLAKTHFHYCSAWLVTILYEPKPIYEGAAQSFKVRIDEIFVENQRNTALDAGVKIPFSAWKQLHFTTGETVQCLFPSESIGELPGTPVVGRQAVWFFNIANNKKDIHLYGVTSPFPKQKFGESVLANLRLEIKQQSARFSALQQNAQLSMERFWTEARLKRVCSPKNEFERAMYGKPALKAGFNGEFFLSGSLFPSRPDLGKFTWYATLRDGEPECYQMDVQKGDSYWRFGGSFPDLLRYRDKNFVDLLEREMAK